MFKKTTKMFLSAFFVFLFTKSSLSNDNLDEEEDYEDEDKDIEGEENEYGSEEESYETVEYTDLNRTFVNLLNQSLPSPTFEMLKPKGFRLTLPEIPKNISEVEYKGVLFKDPFVQHNDTSLNITDYSRFEDDIIFTGLRYMGFLNLKMNMHDHESLKDISGHYIKVGDDYVSVDTSTILRHNYFLQIMTDIDYVDKKGDPWEYELMNAFRIRDPRNGTPPYGEFFTWNSSKCLGDIDMDLLKYVFSTTTNKIYALPEHLQP